MRLPLLGLSTALAVSLALATALNGCTSGPGCLNPQPLPPFCGIGPEPLPPGNADEDAGGMLVNPPPVTSPGQTVADAGPADAMAHPPQPGVSNDTGDAGGAARNADAATEAGLPDAGVPDSEADDGPVLGDSGCARGEASAVESEGGPSER